MIHRISADNRSFKTVTFTPGFNIVLADRTETSSAKDSRNGLGKSTLIEIIHFCLGASLSADHALAHPRLKGWSFTVDFDLGGRKISVTRNTENHKKVFIEADTSTWPIQPKVDKKSGQLALKTGEWIDLLGHFMFGLPVGEDTPAYSPTFRSLIPFFVRNNPHAFAEPFEIYAKQKEWQRQVANSFLLGLEWQHAQELQIIRDKEDGLEELKRAVKTGIVEGFIGDNLGELEARQVQFQGQLTRLASQLHDFKVVEQYREIENGANRLTSKLHDYSNENIQDKRQIENYELALVEERAPLEDEIAALYRGAGVELPGASIKRLEEVMQFHRQVVENRRQFLSEEIASLKRRLEDRVEQVAKLSEERSKLMRILREGRALDEFTALQTQHAKIDSELQSVTQRIANWKRLEAGKSELKIEKEQLAQRARRDFDERAPIRRAALELFNSYSNELYDSPGSLILNVESSGFKFDIEIERQQSGGYRQMKTFCYDLMLSSLWSAKAASPGFLVHDSPIFADVDERQVAHAFILAERESRSKGFQYICTFNSHLLPHMDLPQGFDIEKFVRLRLRDDTEDGGLLGFRY